MPKVAPIQSSFSGGEFSPLVHGRVDFEKYKIGMETCLNYFPTVQGGLTRRPGSLFIGESISHDYASMIIPFEYSTIQAYMINFGNGMIRFFRNRGLITLPPQNITGATNANPVVITCAGHGYSNGDRVVFAGVGGMIELNSREFTVASVTTNTFALTDTNAAASNIDGTAYGVFTSGGTVAKVYQISGGYNGSDYFAVQYAQSADVLYLVHPNYPPRKLTRTSHTSWTLTDIDYLDGPYMETNATSTTLTPNATSGTITVTASSGIFASTDVGRLIRFNHGGTWGWVKISAFSSSTSVTAVVRGTLGGTTAVTTWRLGLWSATTGYPGAVGFHEDRLFLSGSPGAPQRLDGSNTADYENFSPTNTDGTVVASNAVGYNLNSQDINSIIWILSDEKGLQVGTTAGEWIIRPSDQGEALSPTNVSAKPTTDWGSANVQAIKSGKAAIFVQRYGRKLRENTYFFEEGGTNATDLTLLANHITAGGIVEITQQKELIPMIWCLRSDGVLAGMTYLRDQDVLVAGWHRTVIGGYSDAANSPAKIESIAVIPSPTGDYEDLWIVVQRYVNGTIRRHVEVITKLFEFEDDLKDAFYVDAGLTYDKPIAITGATKANPVVITAAAHGFSNGDKVLISDVLGMTDLNTNAYTVASVTTNTFQLSGIDGTNFKTYVSGGFVRKYISQISGLFHLEGQSVSILADGAVQSNQTVSVGKINLPRPATTVQVGLGYNSDGKLLRMEAGSSNGTAMGKTRRTNRIGLLLNRSVGLKIGTSFDSLNSIVFRESNTPLNRAVPLFSGIKSIEFDSDYDFDNQFCFRQDQPLPSTILAYFPQMTLEDRG